MIRILYISNEYPPETGFGGIGTYTRYAAEGMASLGHEVTVVCRSLTNQTAVKKINNVLVCRVPPLEYDLPAGKIMYPLRMFCYKQMPHTLSRLAWAKAARRQYDLLISQGKNFDIIEFPECGAEGYYFAKCKDSARIVRLHTPWEIICKLDRIKEPAIDSKLEPYFERRTVKRAHGISAPSRAMYYLLKDRWKLDNVDVYPNPINFSKYPVRSGERWIYTGRIERRKGVHVLLHAYAQACESSNPPRLFLVGKSYGNLADGTFYGDLIKSLLESYGIKDRVEMIDGVSHDEILKLLSSSGVAFFPSLWENFPYACLEAMACGCAVVASDCGGYPEMIRNGKTGLLFKTESAGALFAAMKKLIDNRSLGSALGQAARRQVKKDFDSATVCKRAESFYTGVQKRMLHG